MKFQTKIATIAALTLGGTNAAKSIFTEFQSCAFSECEYRGEFCCDFAQQDGSAKGYETKFCMSLEQQNQFGKHPKGEYTDELLNVKWQWSCPNPDAPEQKSSGENGQYSEMPYGITGDKGFSFQQKTEWINQLIYWTYWSGAIWPIGLLWLVPVGYSIYNWFYFVSIWNFVEVFMGKGTFWEWIEGPFWQFFMGTIILTIDIPFSLIPVLGILTSWGFAEWATANYMNYIPNYSIWSDEESTKKSR